MPTFQASLDSGVHATSHGLSDAPCLVSLAVTCAACCFAANIPYTSSGVRTACAGCIHNYVVWSR